MDHVLEPAGVVEAVLPGEMQRRAVLSQLVRSCEAAAAVAPAAWGVTLLQSGFRLNVGQVEAFVLDAGLLRVNLAVDITAPQVAGLPVEQAHYRSVVGPQSAFVGDVATFEAVRATLEPLHLAFVERAARTNTGKARAGSPYSRHHSDALMDYACASLGTSGVPRPVPTHEPDPSPYPFKVDESYTRKQVFAIIGIEEPTGGPWFTGYTQHGPDWFIFCGVGASGRTGHDYGNHFEGDRLVWYGKGPSKIEHATIQDLLSPAGRVYLFYREEDRDPFRFAGIASPVEHSDETPVRIVWRFDAPGSGVMPTQLANELDEDEVTTVPEGARRTITVNVYERDPSARLKCIARWGAVCAVCRFDFGKVFGALGEGFIHVHHKRPLGEVGQQYMLDPIIDLEPVCPNCHAMLHRQRPALSTDDLRQLLKDRSQ